MQTRLRPITAASQSGKKEKSLWRCRSRVRVESRRPMEA
jgi:hypothetical protein